MRLNIQLFASGTITFPASGKIQGRILWESTSNGSTANTSTVKTTLQCHRTNTSTTTGKSWTGNAKVGSNDTNYFNGFDSQISIGSDWVTFDTYTDTVEHNEDGTCSVTISGQVRGPSGTSQADSISSGSQTVTLDDIPRGSTLTLPEEATIGETITIDIDKKISDTYLDIFVINPDWDPNGNSDVDADLYLATDVTGTSVSITFPEILYKMTTNGKSYNQTLYATTWSADGQEQIQQIEYTIKMNIDEPDCIPVISNIDVQDTLDYTSLTGSNKRLITGKSRPNYTWEAASKHYATITEEKFNNTNASGSYTAPVITADTQNTISVKDSRTLTSSSNFTLSTLGATLIPWFKPNLSVSGGRLSGVSTKVKVNISGSWFNGYFDANNQNLNDFNLVVNYGNSLTSLTNQIVIPKDAFTIDGNNVSLIDYELSEDFDTNTAYYMQFSFSDSLETVNLGTFAITRGRPLLFWKNNLFRVYGNLEVTGTAKIGGNATINGNIKTLGDVNADGTGTFNSVISNGEAYANGNDRLVRVSEIQPNIISAYLSSSTSITLSAWSEKEITLSGSNSTGNKLTLENGVIKVGSGVSKVLISGNLGLNAAFSNTAYSAIVRIKRGSTSVFARSFYNYKPSTASDMNIATPIGLRDVQEGDVISLNIVSGAAITSKNLTTATCLTVEVVE